MLREAGDPRLVEHETLTLTLKLKLTLTLNLALTPNPNPTLLVTLSRWSMSA